MKGNQLFVVVEIPSNALWVIFIEGRIKDPQAKFQGYSRLNSLKGVRRGMKTFLVVPSQQSLMVIAWPTLLIIFGIKKKKKDSGMAFISIVNNLIKSPVIDGCAEIQREVGNDEGSLLGHSLGCKVNKCLVWTGRKSNYKHITGKATKTRQLTMYRIRNERINLCCDSN